MLFQMEDSNSNHVLWLASAVKRMTCAQEACNVFVCLLYSRHNDGRIDCRFSAGRIYYRERTFYAIYFPYMGRSQRKQTLRPIHNAKNAATSDQRPAARPELATAVNSQCTRLGDQPPSATMVTTLRCGGKKIAFN